jgi:autotransporter-associated beta strand protein
MNSSSINSVDGCIQRFLVTFVARVLPAFLMLLNLQTSEAGSATWLSNPFSGNWNTDANWNPSTGYPNGISDVATFDLSDTTFIDVSGVTTVAEIMFNSGASAFTITVDANATLTIDGTGVTNNSGSIQSFETASGGAQDGVIQFVNSATAGNNTSFTNFASGNPGITLFSNSSSAAGGAFTNNGAIASASGGALTEFFDTSTAGSGTFTNNGGAAKSAGGGNTQFLSASTAGSGTFTNHAATLGGNGGFTQFFGNTNTSFSSAGSGIFTNNGAGTTSDGAGFTQFFGFSSAGSGTFTNDGGLVNGASGGFTHFSDTSTAASGTFTSNAGTVAGAFGGVTQFASTSTAGAATLIANGGTGAGGSILFADSSLGGTSTVKVFDNGNLDISFHTAPGVTIGSLEGNGAVFLGANNLTVGSNNLSKIYSGVMQDGGGDGGTGGSLTKIGKGKLTLSGANTYTGGTTITKGSLLVTNRTGSATGPGPVQVNTGTLGDTGTINGAVTVGNGIRSGAILLPGTLRKPGTLTINNTLTFNSLSAYECVLNRTTPSAGKVKALGVTINANVSFTFVDTTTGTLTAGTIFTVINNTSVNPIFGTFSNLPDGSTFISGGTTFKANYEGGTGNDLTLTVQ